MLPAAATPVGWDTARVSAETLKKTSHGDAVVEKKFQENIAIQHEVIRQYFLGNNCHKGTLTVSAHPQIHWEKWANSIDCRSLKPMCSSWCPVSPMMAATPVTASVEPCVDAARFRPCAAVG